MSKIFTSPSVDPVMIYLVFHENKAS